MFRSSVSNPNADDQEMHNALPNYYGHIRTLREDYAKFKEGRLDEEENFSIKKSEDAKGTESPISLAEKKEPNQIPSPFHPPVPPISPLPENKPGPPVAQFSPSENGFPSRENFKEKPLFEEETSEINLEKEIAKQNGSNKKVFFIAMIFLVLIIGGAGFYYWWFFIKTQKVAAPPSETNSTQTKPPINTENKNLRYLNIDPTSSKTGLEQAFQKFSSDFLSSASENDLAEVKILDTENQPVSIKTFINSFGFSIPTVIQEKLSDDYSLFIKDEKSQSRLGIVFKLDSLDKAKQNLSEWEASIINDLHPLYLYPLPATDKMVFSSSQHKNADIRYFNFPTQNIGSLSLDYSFVNDKVSNYFIVSTSKSSIRSILDYILK